MCRTGLVVDGVRPGRESVLASSVRVLLASLLTCGADDVVELVLLAACVALCEGGGGGPEGLVQRARTERVVVSRRVRVAVEE